jgi:DNA gyrase inhibitor GyrI
MKVNAADLMGKRAENSQSVATTMAYTHDAGLVETQSHSMLVDHGALVAGLWTRLP